MSKQQAESKEVYYIDTDSVKQHKDLGLSYHRSIFDNELQTFMDSIADKEKITRTITHMTRTKAYDEESGKNKEYVFWYETLSAVNHDGNTITISNIPRGVTQQLHGLQYDLGQLIPRDYASKTVYTEEFTPDKAQELIDSSARSEAIEFECLSGNQSYGVATADEFVNCSFKELEVRSRMGISGMYDSSFEITKAPVEQRLAIQQAVIKK